MAFCPGPGLGSGPGRPRGLGPKVALNALEPRSIVRQLISLRPYRSGNLTLHFPTRVVLVVLNVTGKIADRRKPRQRAIWGFSAILARRRLRILPEILFHCLIRIRNRRFFCFIFSLKEPARF